MMNFFFKHKKTRGVITIFLTIIYLAAYIFAGIFVDGARIKMAQTVIEDVQKISNDNIMSQYDRSLYEYYGLMATCGYDPDAIAKEVQKEIKAAIGLEFEEDEVKSFISNCFINASNGNILKFGDASTDEVKNSKNFFKPYDLSVNVASVSTIDLTNIDALRAQIRDEMRYKFPIILGAAFFDELNEFLLMGDAADKIKSIVDKISNENESVMYKQSVYYENLNRFYEEYYNFLVVLYSNNGNLNDDFIDEINEKLSEVSNFFKGILNVTLGWTISALQFITGQDISGGIRKVENYIHRKGIHDAIQNITSNNDDDAFYINKISDEYNSQPWPQANNYFYISNEEDEDDEDYEPQYELDREAFEEAVNGKASNENTNFKEKIDSLKAKIDKLNGHSGVSYNYKENIDIPCLTEFMGFGKNLLTDTLKASLKLVKDGVAIEKSTNLLSELINVTKLLKDVGGTLEDSYKKTITKFANEFNKIGVIPKEDAIGIETAYPDITLMLGGVQDLIDSHEEYRKIVEEKLEYFADEYEKYYNDDDNEKIQEIYASYLEMFLISWVELKTDGEVYKKIQSTLNEIKDKDLKDSNDITNDFTNHIINSDLDQSVYEWVFTKGTDDRKEEPDHVVELLRDRQEEIVNRIKNHIAIINNDCLDNLSQFNDLDSLQSNLLKLCSAVYNIMISDNSELFSHEEHSLQEWMSQGKSVEEARELINSGGTNIYSDPWGHIEPYDKMISPTEPISKLSDDSFKWYKIPIIVSNILSIPKDVCERVPKEFTNDMNDVSYILSFFRDYVHTYRAKELKVIDESGNKDEKYDNILNAKFIEDQSKTEYLTNSQFENIQVTPAEIEYVLWGHEGENSNIENIAQMYTAIFLVRTAINYVSVFFSPKALNKVKDVSSALGPFAPLGIILAPLIYALPQSVIDTKKMVYDCEKVNIYNTGFDLYDPYKDALMESLKDVVSEIEEKSKRVLEQTKNKVKKGLIEFTGKEIGLTFSHDSIINNKDSSILELEMPTTLLILNNIDDINDSKYGPVPDAVKKARIQLERHINNKVYKLGVKFLIEDEETDAENNITNNSNSNKEEDKGLKTGYSTYLTLFLFLSGCTTDGKIEQMTRVQNVIETNMKKVYKENGKKDDSLFKLKKAYVRVAVETDCSVNYIFMTNSFMPTNIKFNDDSKYKFKIRTASSY